MNVRITERDWELIISELEGEATFEEKEEFQKWLENNPENKLYFHQLQKDWLQFGTIESYRKYSSRNAWKKFEQRAGDDLKQLKTISLPSHRSKIYDILKIAASFIVAFSLSWFIWQQLPEKADKVEQTNFEVIVPLGEKVQLVLADGTNVWLNSNSKLIYSSTFGKSNRDIQLTGEAYFDVAHNKAMPFIVTTNNLELKVLGTEFNIREYDNDNTSEATLIEGSLSISTLKGQKGASILLKPDEKITYFRGERKFVRTTIQEKKNINIPDNENTQDIRPLSPIISSEISWKDNVLEFENESFEEIVKKLERWYGKEIQITDSLLLTSRYKGKFENNETIFQVLEVIKKTTPITYIAKHNVIYIDLNE